MARRYVRDNRGRFASTGATARGGRLRTAAGNKRATVKGKIEGAVPGGTIRPGRRSKPKAVEAPTSGRTAARLAGNNASRLAAGKSFKRTGKAQRVAGEAPKGTISASRDTRNKRQREAAFKRRMNRAYDNQRGAGKVYQTYGAAHKYGNAPGQGVKIERSYKQALRREATAKKAIAIYQGTARPSNNDSRVWGRPYGMSRPAVSRTSKGYRPAAERLRTPSKAAQRQGRAAARHASASADRRHYRGVNRAASLGTTARAAKFYKSPLGYLARAKGRNGRLLSEGAGFRLPRNNRR